MFLQQKFKYLNLHLRGLATAAALFAWAAAPAHADSRTALSQLQGWVNSDGGNNGSKASNMYTGVQAGKEFNSWAIFFIPAGHYTSASLTFDPAFWGDNGANKIGIYDVSTTYQSFASDTFSGTNVFQDLGSGAQYGTATLLDARKTVNLNGAAVYDINSAAGTYMVFGFTNLTLDPSSSPDGGIYLNKFGRQQVPLELHLITSAVPEPGNWAMLAGGLGVIGCMTRRRRQQPA
jgi:hypothetical protein